MLSMGKIKEGMSGDSIEVEAGGVVRVQSGASIDVQSGGVIAMASGASITADGSPLVVGELGALDGASSANDTTGKVAILGTNGAVTFAGAVTHQVSALTSFGVGAKNGATVSAIEQGDGAIHRTALTLTATPVTLTDDAGSGQYGSVKLYDMPAGNMLMLAAVVDANLTLVESWWTDNAVGDVGLGSVAVTNGDALASTEQNIIPTTEIAAMAAQVGAIDCLSTASQSGAILGTTAAALDIILNLRIDDQGAHMPNAVTNGAFGSDTAWTQGTGWTIAAGVADCDGTQEDVSDLSQNVSAVQGVGYIVTCTVTRAAGTITPYLGGTAGTARSSSDTFVETITAGADGILLFRADADFVGTVDDVSATPVTGSGTITGSVTLLWSKLGDI